MSVKLPVDIFQTVVKSTPLISLDLLVMNTRDEVLLGERCNRPAQGFWFVPGGRILKDESIAEAFDRITQEELGARLPFEQASFSGVYEHFYPDNFSTGAFSTHYIVLAYRVVTDLDIAALPSLQHQKFVQKSMMELLADDRVHPYTRNYFKKELGQ